MSKCISNNLSLANVEIVPEATVWMGKINRLFTSAKLRFNKVYIFVSLFLHKDTQM